MYVFQLLFLNKNYSNMTRDVFKLSNDDQIELKYPVNGYITMMTGNVDFNNLQIIPAHCNIKIATTYACTSCKVDPYVLIVFESYNIQQEGIMPMETNCSFNTNYLSCSRDKFVIKLKSKSSDCWIYLKTINKH